MFFGVGAEHTGDGLENIGGRDFDAQLRNSQRRNLDQSSVAGVEALCMGIDEPHVGDTPRAVFGEFIPHLGHSVVRRKDFNRNEWR